MITKLYIFWCSIITICLLKEISHTTASRLIIIDLITLILVSSLCSDSILGKFHYSVFTVNCNFFHISLIASLIVRLIFLSCLITILSLAIHYLVQIAILKIRINGLPLAAPVTKLTIFYVLICKMRIAMIMTFLRLHTRHCLFCLNCIL